VTQEYPEGMPVLGTTIPSGLDLPPTPPESSQPDYELKFPTLPSKLPRWYAPGFYSEGNMRRRLDRLDKAGYGVPNGPDYRVNLLTEAAQELVDRRLATGATTTLEVERRLRELSKQYPLASPDMLVALSVSGGTPDPALMSADQSAYMESMSSLSTVGSASAGSAPKTAPMGVSLDRRTKGTVTLPNGVEYQITPGDVVVRDPDGGIVDIIVNQDYMGQAPGEERFATPGLQALKFAAKAFFYALSMPYEGLVGAARNVGQTLSEGGLAPAALLDAVSYLPLNAAIREIIQGDDYINPWEQTYMGQLILAAARGERIDVGNGWFISEDSDIFQRQLEAAAGAYSIDGQAFTFGRGVAGAFDMDPNTMGYRVASGFVDFTTAIVLDPTVWAAGLGVPSASLDIATRAPAARSLVRGTRGALGMEKGTGRIQIGLARKRAALNEARILRYSEELPKAQGRLQRLREQAAQTQSDLGKREQWNAEIEEAARKVAQLEREAKELVDEQNALRTITEIEEAVAEQVPLKVKAEEEAARNLLGTRSTRLADLADQSREAEARLGILQEVAESSSPLQALTSRAVAVGDTVERNGRPWKVVESGEQLVIESEKGARRRLDWDNPATRDLLRAKEQPLHSRDELRTALLNLTERGNPEDLAYQSDALEGLRSLPGDVTVREPEVGPDLGVAVGMLDGDSMVATWVRKEPPQLVHAAEEVPDTVMERLWGILSEKVFRQAQKETQEARKALRAGGPEKAENLSALEKAVLGSEALGDDLLRLLAPDGGATPTWGDLLDGLNDRGLAPYLERVLREDGFDGIAGLISRQPLDTDGIWWGYNQGIASYRAKVGRLTADPNLRLRVDAKSGQSDIALVLDDSKAAVDEIVKVQDEIDTLTAQRQKVWQTLNDEVVDQEQVRSALGGLDRALDVLKERWTRLSADLAPIPNYTADARAARIKELQGSLKGNLAERARLRDVRKREARVVERLNASMASLAERMADEERVVEGLRIAAGASSDGAGRGAVSLDATERFLFGGATGGALSKAGRMALEVMADTKSPSKIHAMTRFKLPDEVVQEIVDVTRLNARTAHEVGYLDEMLVARGYVAADAATGAQRVATDISPAVLDSVFREWKQGRVSEILAKNIGLTLRSPLSKGAIFQAGAHPGPGRYRVGQKTHPYTKRMRQLVPAAVKVDLNDPKDTAMGLKKYMDSAGIPAEEQYRIMDRLWDEPSGLIDTQDIVGRNVLTETFDMMNEKMVESVRDIDLPEMQRAELLQAMRKATRVYLSGERNASIYWRTSLGTMDTPIRLKMTDGTSMPISGAQLESEMAHGAIFLPDPEAFRMVVRRASKTLSGGTARAKDRRGPVIRDGMDAVNRLFSDYWRSFMLLRPAYVVRNLMEMQVRNFLTGHMNIVTNPIATIAMAIGPTVSPNGHLGKMMDSLAPYTHDVHGFRFGFRHLDDSPAQAEIIERAHAQYLEIIRMDRALVDLRMYTGKTPGRRGAPIIHGLESERFAEGWAEELLLLRGSPLSRILAGGAPADIRDAIARNPDARETIITNFVFKDSRTEEIREIFRSAGPEYQRMVADRVALSDFLFGTGGNLENVQRRLDDMTGLNEQLVNFVATGNLVTPTGRTPTLDGRVLTAMPNRHTEQVSALQRVLTGHFKNSDAVHLPENVRVWTPEKVSHEQGYVDRFLDAFFRMTTRMERVGVMGPEWRYVYWEAAKDLAPDMTAKARDRMVRNMEKTGLTLRSHGKPIPSISAGYKKIKDSPGAGALTVEDVHRIASDVANEHVRDLYYDAHKRNQFWHALRLVIPFGQAWADTWATWTRLSAQNPVQFYKAQKAFNAGMETGSNVIYEATDHVLPTGDTGWFESPEGSAESPWYDPRQGFLFRDNYGAYTFNIPVLGHALGALTNMLANGSPIDQGGLQSGFRVEGMNLLFGGGTMLPGLGPILQMPLAPVLNRADTGTGVSSILYDWLYPVGEPDLSRSIFDQMIPAAVRRLGATMTDPNSPYVMTNMSAATNFLLSKGDYDLTSQAERERLQTDAIALSKRMGAITAIGQFVLPTTPTRTWVGETADGNRVGLAAAASLYWDGYVPLFEDSQSAQTAFIDDFGEHFLSAFVGQTEGDVNITKGAWALIQEYPDLGRAYAEELTFLFPEGGTEALAYQWQKEVLQRKHKTAAEWHREFWKYMVTVRKARIEEKAIQTLQPDAVTEADLAYVDEQVQAFMDEVAQSGGYEVTFKQGADLIESTKKMLETAPTPIKETENVQVFFQMYAWREQMKAKAKEVGVKELDTKAMQPYTGIYLTQLEQVQVAYPQLAPMIRRFKQEVV
jgi:hypothetical protein